MNALLQTQIKAAPTPSFTPTRAGFLQRACACGQHSGNGGECEACRQKRLGLQRQATSLTTPDTAPRFEHEFSQVPAHGPYLGLAISQPGDHYEQEAEHMAAQVVRAGTSQARPGAIRLTGTTPLIQRAPLDDDQTADDADAEETGGLLVEDDAGDLAPGQMRKSSFLSAVRDAVAVVVPDEQTASLDSRLDDYSDHSAQQIESDIHHYISGTADATAASDYIPAIVISARQSFGAQAAAGSIGESSAANDNIFFKRHDRGARSATDPQAIRAQLGAGTTLDSAARGQMESAFGYDFSHVRIHTNSQAASLSAGLNARAFTIGRDVAFGAGEYQPGTLVGDALLAHELAHVVQQGGGSAAMAPLQADSTGYSALEADADSSAIGVVGALWGKAKGAGKELAEKALPELRSGLRLSRCNGCGSRGCAPEQELDQSSDAGTPAPTPQPTQPPPSDAGTPEPARQPPLPAAPTAPCTTDVASNAVIVDHRVTPALIQRPGDRVTITATFACLVRGDGFSKFVAPDGTTFGKTSFPRGLGRFERTWDGKKLFTGIGTFLVNDGNYHHELEPFTYAMRGGKESKADGPRLRSPAIRVNVRGFSGPGADHFHFTPANVDALAEIIQSEMGVGNDAEKRAVAWCVRNQMIRHGTADVVAARDQFRDAHDQAATPATRTMAEAILKQPMSNDITSGSIKWFSPRSMPREGQSCTGVDCGGGLIDVNDEGGTKVRIFAPTWHRTMRFNTITGVREWFLRVYAL